MTRSYPYPNPSFPAGDKPAPAPGAAAGDVPSALSVTQALNMAKGALEGIRVTVEGEVSELSDKPGYKAVYFTLSDGTSALPCLMWKNAYEGCGLVLELGMLVEVTGTFSVYAAKGRMNFKVNSISPAGEGNLRVKVARIARKLEKEGLMDPRRKRALPSLPEKVAIVTSPRGKAVHDCLRTLRRRFALTEVYVCGVTVEGRDAPADLMRGLDVAARSDAEVILLVRGGGSYEDLMPFNDETLARAVAACPKPVVTGIGHEPDNSICDMVADLRCSTPTAAAEAVVPDVSQVKRYLDSQAMRMGQALRTQTERADACWERLSSRTIFKAPDELLSSRFIAHDAMRDRLNRAIPDALAQDSKRFDLAMLRFKGLSERLLVPHDAALKLAASRLEDLSPLSVLSRGYSVTYDEGGRIVDSLERVQVGDDIAVRLKDGFLDARVTGRREAEGVPEDGSSDRR